MSTKLPWWRSDTYDWDAPLPGSLIATAGPKGVALVRAYPDDRTDPGWGLNPPKGSTDGFMPRYMRGEFAERRIVYGFEKGKWNFAIVMRSVRLVCIDIDGKNGGFEHAKRLGLLPPTLAERSKSGNGYHLFYSVDEEWDDTRGYGALGDRIGIEQGVDIRATGCVFHYPQQRWNHRGLKALPDHLYDRLRHREQKVTAAYDRIAAILQDNDELEVLMLKEEILEELAKPIPQGKRNNTLFAIGNQMRAAEIQDWDQVLADKCNEVGLDADETQKLIENIERYGGTP